MTYTEKKAQQELRKAQQKKNESVLEAGRGAYRMLIPINGNLHTKQPYRDLWAKGWRLERNKEQARRFADSRPAVVNPAVPTVQTVSTAEPTKVPTQHNQRRRELFTRPKQAPKTRQAPAPRPEPPSHPILTNSLIDRFNRRHQTRA